jgi:hypothetical protein
MVRALVAVHRRLRPRGILLDIRPDVSRDARILSGGRVRARMPRDVDADHAGADAAIDRVVERGLFGRISRGTLWYASRFEHLDALEAYLSGGEHAQRGRDAWRTRVAPYGREPLTLRRAAKFELLVRCSARFEARPR